MEEKLTQSDVKDMFSNMAYSILDQKCQSLQSLYDQLFYNYALAHADEVKEMNMNPNSCYHSITLKREDAMDVRVELKDILKNDAIALSFEVEFDLKYRDLFIAFKSYYKYLTKNQYEAIYNRMKHFFNTMEYLKTSRTPIELPEVKQMIRNSFSNDPLDPKKLPKFEEKTDDLNV